jgi:Ca2+-binding RTX toxin-like protein
MKTAGYIRWSVLAAFVTTVAVLLTGAGSAGAAFVGTDVAHELGRTSAVVGGLSGSVGNGGAYGRETNAGSVPFLGGAPGGLLSGVFDALGPLAGFDNFSPIATDKVKVVDDKVNDVDNALGSGQLVDRVYTCGSAPCQLTTDTVDKLTAIQLRLAVGGSSSGDIDFTSLGLPSLRFLPKGAKQLHVDVSWSANVKLIVDGDGLRLAADDNDHELSLGATITLPTGDFTVDLGALVVKATTLTQPQFKGTLNVDADGNGGFNFSFGDDSGFHAGWHLQTEDSPLMGVQGDLKIDWNLGGAGVSDAGLRIAVDNVKIDTKKFVGEGVQSAAADLREVTHPIRTATSPLMEPIPGLSDLSAALNGEPVTMLRLMEEAESFPSDVRKMLTKLAAVDDVVSALAGDQEVSLGSFTLVGSDALKPADQPLRDLAQSAFDKLANIVDKDVCPVCKEKVDDLLKAVNGDATPGEGDFQFDLPVLRDPASLAGLLLGRDVDLIKFDTGRIGYPRNNLDIPLVRFLIFSVKLDGPIEATIHLKGGVDTKGISDALAHKQSDELLHGVYLQNPDDGPVVRVVSEAGLGLTADLHPAPVGVEIHGGPDVHVSLIVPPSAPDKKLRPAVVADGIGCALLEDPEARADFGVNVTATFEYIVDTHTETLAEHTFLTKDDLCAKDNKDVPVARLDLPTRTLTITTATERGVKPDEPDTVKVFMRHAPGGAPTSIAVTVNSGRHDDFPADQVGTVIYESDGDRPVIFRAVENDDKAFEKNLTVETGEGDDDVLLDTDSVAKVHVNGGNDKVILSAGTGTDIVTGGTGDDYLAGGSGFDALSGGEGDDKIFGGGGGDVLDGGPNRDTLMESSSAGNNCLKGGPGDDQLLDGPGADHLFGDDTFFCNGDFDQTEDGSATDGKDAIVTGGGSDLVVAGNGGDEVRVANDNSAAYDRGNAVWKAGVTVYGNGGADHITTGNGGDYIHGGSGDDTIASDGGPRDAFALRNGGRDTVYGGLGADTIDSGDDNDTVYGDNGVDTCTPPIVGQPAEKKDNAGGADTVDGGNDADHIALEAGDDHANGRGGDDVICGHAGTDTIDGGADDDTAFGGTGTDTITGGSEKDELYGNAGSDTINGGDDADRIVGGSSATGIGDSGDTIDGGDGDDVVIGDNGTISNASPRVPSVFDLFANDGSLGGSDTITGGIGADRAFGGIAGDTIRGGGDDDHLEGNSGDDAVYGEGGQDDVVGGTSPESLPTPASGQAADDAPDSGETILSGGDAQDVIVGDNGTIDRTGGADGITGGVARTVTLLDRARTGTQLAAVSGADYIEGNAERDRLYGEGGNDYVKGNESDDYAEGNQGADRLEGDDGEDDLIGGSSFTSSPGVGDPDAGDQLAGGAGGDVLLGDNAIVVRTATTGADWDSVANNWLGTSARRSITLLDKATLNAGRFGDDVLSGGAGPDAAIGQDGDDRLYGGSEDDYQEGNGGHDVLYGDQVAPPTGSPHETAAPDLDGVQGPAGQDDQIGGSSWAKTTAANGAVTGQRDTGDELHGDGNADVQLGDNGRVLRVVDNSAYRTYLPQTGKPTIVRQAAPNGQAPTALPARFDVGAASAAGVWGNDTLYGDDGDDLQLAEDGNDTLYGGGNDDDMYGELGNDRMLGEAGEDAMLGDRGVIANALVATPGATFSTSGPPQISYTPYAAHPLDRRANMNDDGDGSPLQSPGMTTGGGDFMRGGPDHDAMHGEAGNDLMNGDSGGDYLFGDDGVDVMFGGKGRDCADPTDLACNSDHGVNDSYVDYLFGGNGLKTDPVTGGADILDFRPRPGIDPAAWFELTSTAAADPVAAHQHHQGIDWIYGGWDRDVMQADIADNGPNLGDRLLDWTGAYNLYTHCPAAYGGYNDVRQFSPDMQSFLEKLAYSLGAGKSLTDVQTKGTSGYSDLALVYNADVKSNSGSSYPTTPGHFDQFSCAA